MSYQVTEISGSSIDETSPANYKMMNILKDDPVVRK
jgi:hypothetical protein